VNYALALLFCLAMLAARGAGKEIVFLELPGAPSELTGEEFVREFGRPSIATAEHRLTRVPVDLFDPERLGKQIDEVVARSPALIVAPASRPALFVKARSASIPTLFVSLADPSAIGLVKDPSAPEANLTGFTYELQEELKRFEVAAQALAPNATVCLVVDRAWPSIPRYAAALERARKQFQLSILLIAEDELAAVMRRVAGTRQRVDAWIVPDTALSRKAGAGLVKPLLETGGIILTERREMLEAGAHVLLAPSIENPLRTLAEMADLLLSGVPVRKIPIAVPKRFVTLLNMNAVALAPAGRWQQLILTADGFIP
jgi:ABC-type uncharacterized transport system substrate-binding protein